MKFHVAWDSLEKENQFLKILLFSFLIVTLGLAVTIIAVSAKDPILVERGCYSRLMERRDPVPTKEEMVSFAEEALKARFNSSWTNPSLLSDEQNGFRTKEQAELTRQKMKQAVVVNKVESQSEYLIVDADRVISVGDIRSSFRFPLKLKVERSTRTAGNPYGVVLYEVSELKAEVKR